MLLKGKYGLCLLTGITAFLMLCIGMLQAACTPQQPQAITPQLPSIDEFYCDPSSILPGQPSTLKWAVKDATTVAIDHGIGVVDLIGKSILLISENTTYTLIATNAGGTVTRSTTILVCPTCACNFFDPPKFKGYEDYWDKTNCFWIPYPSTWTIDKERFARINSLAGGVFSGVSFSNNKTGDDYAYCDVLLKPKGADFDLQSYADQFKAAMIDKDYNLISEDVRLPIITEKDRRPFYISQSYICTHADRKFDCEVILAENEGKLWTVRIEGPDEIKDQIRYISAFSILRWNYR